MSRDPARRAVVTGLGAITPDRQRRRRRFWTNLLAGTSGVGPITAYDASGEEVRIAAEVKGFDPATYMDFKQARRMSRFSQLAVAAAAQAIADAALEVTDANRDDIAVVVNTGGGGIGDVALGERIFLEQGGKRVSPFMVPMLSPSMAACQISIQNQLRGPVMTSVAACASGVQALVEAQRLIEHGDVDVVIAGGTESAILPVAFAALANMGALSKRNDEPERALATRSTRIGMASSSARARPCWWSRRPSTPSAAARASWPRWPAARMTGDAFHISAPDPSGEGAARAMTRALRDAGVGAEEVDYVVAHGTSTPLNDATETKAIHLAFGEHAARLAVSSNKSMIGHTLGAAGRHLGAGRGADHPRRDDPADRQLREARPRL